MRIVCISDTHLQHNFKYPVPDGDLLIHAGDFTFNGTKREFEKVSEWFNAFPHKHKVYTAGNHDWLFEKYPEMGVRIMGSGCRYLADEYLDIEGLRVYGSPCSLSSATGLLTSPEGQNWLQSGL